MHILLVDDDLQSLNSLSRFLQLSGHSCDTFTHPCQALAEYVLRNHDLVITDLRMPEMDGIQLLQSIRAINPEATVIIITGYATDTTAAYAQKQGAYGFFAKPVNLEHLLTIIDSFAT